MKQAKGGKFVIFCKKIIYFINNVRARLRI